MMLHSTYPITDSTESITVDISHLEPDPLSEHGDYQCLCTLTTPNGKEEFHAHGVDETQTIWLGLRQIKRLIENFEKETGRKCEYTFFSGDIFVDTKPEFWEQHFREKKEMW